MHFKKVLAIITIIGSIPFSLALNSRASACPDLSLIFIRGSGEERETGESFQSFKNSLEPKLKTTSLTYDFTDLDYPAISVTDLSVLLGAFVSGGEAYAFGESVDAGAKKLISTINSTSCPNTKFVLGGYSQGAMVISKTLSALNPDKIIYAATFGDPKLYLPEGEGIFPDACRNMNLSNYRIYVPDCYAYQGILGGYIPYQPESFIDKLGTWCNKKDILCSSHINVDDHVHYVEDGLFEDASRLIFDKITRHFEIKNTVSSPHDTAILIDTTGSMGGTIDLFKKEALRLAKETIEHEGRIALFSYRDLGDPYETQLHCDFNCTLEEFEEKLIALEVNGGGDAPESLLSASLSLMTELKWQRGATKSVVVLTDAGFHDPDIDGVTFDQVVSLSRTIDPVNFYIITESRLVPTYEDLATETDGQIFIDFDKLSLVTDHIMERYDSLPRVELGEPVKLPTIRNAEFEKISDNAVKLKIDTDAEKIFIALNDGFIGITESHEVIIEDIDFNTKNVLRVVPIQNETKGEAVTLTVESEAIIGVPNTGSL